MLVPVQLFRYIQKAFTNHWNLLGLVGGIGFSFLSGSPLIGLPLVAAAEIAWLGIVGTHPRFQQYVDVTENEVVRSQDERRGAGVLGGLPKPEGHAAPVGSYQVEAPAVVSGKRAGLPSGMSALSGIGRHRSSARGTHPSRRLQSH